MSVNFPYKPINNSNISSLSIEPALDHVWSLINNKAVPQANADCAELNRKFPHSTDAWYASSFLAFQLKDISKAILLINKAIALEPQNVQWQLHKAQSLLLFGDIKSTQALIATLISNAPFNQCKLDDKQSLDPSVVDNFAEVALILNKVGNFELSEFYYQQAINLVTGSSKQRKAQLFFNLATVQRYLGKIDDAEVSLTAAIELNPYDYEAYLLRSSLKKQTNEKNHVNELEQVLNTGIEHPVAKAQVYYALAKEFEDLKQYEQSFEYLTKGAQSRRSNIRYDVEHDIATLNTIIEAFNPQFFEQQAKQNELFCNNGEAIFVLGLPRTGSTLVDRIISNHTDVDSAGELNDFALQMMEQVKAYCYQQNKSGPKNKLELVSLTTKINFTQLGKSYIESTRNSTGKSKHFIDKSPLNSLYVGLISLALPRAKIIHVIRHPMDTCYAIYKQLFTQGYPFSYDLKELGQYYIAHHKLMQHWQDVIPGAIHQIAYEDVIDNIEDQAKALILQCDLTWQSQCIDFQNNKSASTTASATQVRQGIYKSSQGKWREFAQQLAPLKAQLEQAGIYCD